MALYILVCALISLAAAAMLPDYTNRDISREHGTAAALGQAAEG